MVFGCQPNLQMGPPRRWPVATHLWSYLRVTPSRTLADQSNDDNPEGQGGEGSQGFGGGLPGTT